MKQLYAAHAVAPLTGALDELLRLNEEFTAERSKIRWGFVRSSDRRYVDRTLIRLESSRMEGINALMKQLALAAAQLTGVKFTKTETDIMKNVRFVSALRNFDACWRCLRKAVSFRKKPGGKTTDWQLLSDALKIRTRVVHPRNASDLDLSDDDMVVFNKATNWYQVSVTQLLEETARALARLSRGKSLRV